LSVSYISKGFWRHCAIGTKGSFCGFLLSSIFGRFSCLVVILAVSRRPRFESFARPRTPPFLADASAPPQGGRRLSPFYRSPVLIRICPFGGSTSFFYKSDGVTTPPFGLTISECGLTLTLLIPRGCAEVFHEIFVPFFRFKIVAILVPLPTYSFCCSRIPSCEWSFRIRTFLSKRLTACCVLPAGLFFCL